MFELIRLPFTILAVCFHGIELLFSLVLHLTVEQEY